MKLYAFIFLLVGLLTVFVIPTVKIYRNSGINPVTFGKEDNAHNYVGKIFKILIGLIIVVIAIYFISAEFYETYLVPIKYLENQTIFITGIALIHVSFIFIFVAQMQMGKSWRIGIDEKNDTQLVTSGLFSISRNPIFLGMIVALFAVFMMFPNVFTFFTAFCGYIVIQLQIRLEEEFLLNKFGTVYLSYKSKTRRLI